MAKRRNGPKNRARQRRANDVHHRERDAQLRDEWENVAEEPYRPLDEHIHFLQVILASPRKAGLHPNFVWGQYRDADSRLLAVDCLKETSTRGKLGTGDLHMDGGLAYSLGGENQRAQLRTTDVYYFVNDWQADLRARPHVLDTEYLPDLILRRAFSILYDNRPQDTGLFVRDTGAVRHGLVFRELETRESRGSRFVPEAIDAPFEQAPLFVPDYLSQDEIDTIFRLARNYAGYCMHLKLPVLFPEPKQWGRWPESFMAFAETRSSYRDVDMIWLRNKTPVMIEKGFSCEPS